MKVEGIAKRKPQFGYCIEVEFDDPVSIRADARVTVEWDNDVHECEEMPKGIDIIYNGQCWNVWECKDHGRIKQLAAVLHCPYCGRKLGG